MKSKETWDTNLKLFDEIVDLCPRFVRKGKTMPYTSANGHMFSLLNKAGTLGIRFSKEVQEKYFEEYSTKQFMSHGAKVHGYIVIPDALLTDQKQIIKLLNESYDHVMGLKPK